MATVLEVPSFWDYLGQAVTTGHQAFMNQRANIREQNNQEFEQAARLFSMGALDSSDVNAAASKAGKKFNVQANPQEMARRIMREDGRPPVTTAIPNMMGGTAGTVQLPTGKQFTDDQRRFAGLPTAFDRAKEALERRKMGFEGQKVGAAERFMAGGQISEPEAETLGVQTPQQRQAKRLTELQKPLEEAASRYTSDILLRTNGRLQPQQLSAVANQAYEAWLRERGSTMNITPEENVFARAYFSDAVAAAYRAQLQMDLQKELANIRAEASGSRGFNPATMLNALGRMAETEGKSAASMVEGGIGQAIRIYSGKPLEEVPEQFRADVQKYQQKMQSAERFRQAQAAFGAGVLSPEQASEILAEYVTQQQAGGAPPPNVMQPSPAGAQPAQGGKKQVPAADRERAKNDPGFRRWLRQNGYDI